MAIMMGKVIINHQVWRYPLLDKPNSQKPEWRTVENGGDLHQSSLNILNIQKTSKKIQWSMSCDHTPFNILWCQAAQSILPSHWETCHHFPQSWSSKPPSLRSRVARSEQHRNHEPDRNHRNHRNLDFYPHEGFPMFSHVFREIQQEMQPGILSVSHCSTGPSLSSTSFPCDLTPGSRTITAPAYAMRIGWIVAGCKHHCQWSTDPKWSKWSLTLLIHGI